MNKVCVLMSTYNGEKYLIEQIESILAQKEVEVHLLVRDDGSTDKTIDILKKYQSENKLEFYQDGGNLGPACSFMDLLYSSPEYDYYSFADQDDVWLEEKLIASIRKLEDLSDVPALYCSNQLIYKNGEVKGVRFLEIPEHGIIQAICGNVFSGCTMVFNSKLANVLKCKQHRPDEEMLKIRMHDTWVMAVAEYVGKVIYDNNSYIKYRIHDNNTVGLKANRVNRLLGKIVNKKKRGGRSRLARDLLKIKGISDSDVSAMANQEKINILKNKTIRENCGECYLQFVIKTLLGWN